MRGGGKRVPRSPIYLIVWPEVVQRGVWLGGFWPGSVCQEGVSTAEVSGRHPPMTDRCKKITLRNYVADSNNGVALCPWGWYSRHLRNPGSVTGFCVRLFCHFILFRKGKSFFMKR